MMRVCRQWDPNPECSPLALVSHLKCMASLAAFLLAMCCTEQDPTLVGPTSMIIVQYTPPTLF